MGLGETVPVIALFLASLGKAAHDHNRQPTLIVTPKSLLPVWVEKVETRAVGLDFVWYYGGQRKNKANQDMFETYHVVRLTLFCKL